MTALLNGAQLSMGPDTTGHFALVSVQSHCLIKAFFLLINHQSVFSVSDINFTKRFLTVTTKSIPVNNNYL